MLSQSFVYYAIGFYIPTISSIMFGGSAVASFLSSAVAQTFAMLGGFAGALLTSRLGVRRIGLIGYFIVFGCLLVLGLTAGKWSSIPLFGVTLLFVLMAAYQFGPGEQGKSIAPLSFPTFIRGVATGWGETMGRVGGFLGQFLFPIMLVGVGQSSTMFIMMTAPALAIVTGLVIKWEPIGKNVEADDAAVISADVSKESTMTARS